VVTHVCCGPMNALKKCCKSGYQVKFYVVTGADPIVQQLISPTSDLLEAQVTCWTTLVQLFDFNMKGN